MQLCVPLCRANGPKPKLKTFYQTVAWGWVFVVVVGFGGWVWFLSSEIDASDVVVLQASASYIRGRTNTYKGLIIKQK